jgi:hypothetical protein
MKLGIAALALGFCEPAFSAWPNDIANRMQKAIEETLKYPECLYRIKDDAPVIFRLPGAEWSKSLLSNMELLRPFVSKMK